MQIIDVSSKAEKVAEIKPPLNERWFIFVPTTNTGYISVVFPNKSANAYPLRPGSKMAIAEDYVGDIVMGLGWPGTKTPTRGQVVFFSSEEEEKIDKQYADATNTEPS